MTNPILSEIEAFIERTKMPPTTFGRRSCGDAKVIARLRNGGRIFSDTERKIRYFMTGQRDA